MRIPLPIAAFVIALVVGAAPLARQAQPPASQAQPPAGQAPQPQPPDGQKPSSQSPPPAPMPETPGQTTDRAQQRFRTGINFVRVDAIVTDKQGNPVLDLKPEEFSISEDNKPQTIETFSVVKIDATSQVDAPAPTAIRDDTDEEREAARPDVRLFVILLDDYHVRRGNDMSVRKPLIDFIENQLAPADMVAIMYPLTPVADLHFSRDRGALVRAIEHFEGRKFEYTPKNEFEERYAYYPAATVERIRNDITMGALKGAAIKLGGLREGRKSIIFVSEGFTGTLPPQLNDPIAALPRLGNPARGNPSVQGPGDTVEFFNEADLMSDMQLVFDTANRQNTSIYSVDPRGLASFEYGVDEAVGLQADTKRLNSTVDTLRVLAENTDGRAIVNRNDLALGMKQIIRDASGYYLIGYSSSQMPTDGRFHSIKVRVSRKGVDVRARKGYWAYTAEDAARALAPPTPEAPSAVTEALNAIAEPPRGRAARFWLGTSRGPNGSPRVTFSWEAIAQEAGSRNSDDPASRVMLTVTAPDGRPVFRGRVPETNADPDPDAARSVSLSPAPSSASSPSSSAASSASGARSGSSPASAGLSGATTSFDAPPGQLQLRMVVENSHGQVMDSATEDITVPDFSKVQVSMSTPRVYRARTPREIQAIMQNSAAPVTVDRTFSRTERLLIKVGAYASAGGTPTLSARLLNRAGKEITSLPLQAGPTGEGQLELGLSSLAAGDYVIEMNAKTDTGTAQEFVGFKVSR
jgi:VWFA-related protein